MRIRFIQLIHPSLFRETTRAVSKFPPVAIALAGCAAIGLVYQATKSKKRRRISRAL